MSEINTTSINDLPTDPTAGGSVGGSVVNEITISQIVNGLQQASLAGATTLPSRDIPQNTEQLTNDAQIQPNYVPPPQIRDYINESDNDIDNYYKNEQQQHSLDAIYDELQAPLLLAVLYFLFQLPFFKKNVFRYLPFLCHSDGNYNFNGLVFTCGLFGFIYYSLSKTVKRFSKF